MVYSNEQPFVCLSRGNYRAAAQLYALWYPKRELQSGKVYRSKVVTDVIATIHLNPHTSIRPISTDSALSRTSMNLNIHIR